jgi:acyl carrier protein
MDKQIDRISLSAQIIRIVKDVTSTKIDIEPESNLNDCGVDSVALVQIIVKIENELGIVFDENDLSPELFRTVNNISAYLLKK